MYKFNAVSIFKLYGIYKYICIVFVILYTLSAPSIKNNKIITKCVHIYQRIFNVRHLECQQLILFFVSVPCSFICLPHYVLIAKEGIKLFSNRYPNTIMSTLLYVGCKCISFPGGGGGRSVPQSCPTCIQLGTF